MFEFISVQDVWLCIVPGGLTMHRITHECGICIVKLITCVT